jgi:prevent-host-death family protein
MEVAAQKQSSYNSHMKKATISQAKNKLSQLIDWVKGGETVIIMDRNVPVAKLEPIGPMAAGDSDGRLERLARQGLLTRGKGGGLSREFFKLPLAKPRKGGDILKALLADREESW